MERDPRTIGNEDFETLVHGFEQDWVEFKRGLRPDKEAPRAEFCFLTAGLSNRGGGWLIVGPFAGISTSDQEAYDPARLNQLVRSVLSAVPILSVHRRDGREGTYILIEVPAPDGAPVMFKRPVGKYLGGQAPFREGTSTSIITDSAKLQKLYLRWSFGRTQLDIAPTSLDFLAHYFSQSSDLSLLAGSTGQFATGYLNAGRRPWPKDDPGGATLILSPFQDARHTVIIEMVKAPAVAHQANDIVNPGQVGFFIFNVRVPADAAMGTAYAFHAHPCVRDTQVGPDTLFRVNVLRVPDVPPAVSDPSVTGLTQPNATQLRILFSSTVGLSMSERGSGMRNPDNYVLDGLPGSRVFDLTNSRVDPGGLSITLTLPSRLTGTHSLHVKDVVDAAGRVIVPNPTSFTVTFN